MRRRRRSTASSAAAIAAAGMPKTSAVPQCWREVRARIDSRPVSRICIVSVAMTTATGQPPELHRPLPAELLVTDAAHRLAMIAAPRAPARGATNAWGMAYLFVKSLSCTSLLDRSQQRPALFDFEFDGIRAGPHGYGRRHMRFVRQHAIAEGRRRRYDCVLVEGLHVFPDHV